MGQATIKGVPQVNLHFDFAAIGGNPGNFYRWLTFTCWVNNGYTLRCRLHDNNRSILNKWMIKQKYFKEVRKAPSHVKFQILAGPDGKYPDSATKQGDAIITSFKSVTTSDSNWANDVEFEAISPPDWYLWNGAAAGKLYTGKVSDVIKQCCEEYLKPGGISVQVSKTTDSEQGQWWMMRQDPHTFISSLMDWSSSITSKRTNWLVEVQDEGQTLKIYELAESESKNRGVYRLGPQGSVVGLEILGDNAFSLSSTKLVTAGLSSISGTYYDKKTDKAEEQVYAKDKTTPGKKFANVDGDDTKSYDPPPDSEPPDSKVAGYTAIHAIPEFNAGELGVHYQDFIDGCARNIYLQNLALLHRIRVTVIGTGEYSDGVNLGSDTIYIIAKDSQDDAVYLEGFWLLQGFQHRVSKDRWYVDLYCTRNDVMAQADYVP